MPVVCRLQIHPIKALDAIEVVEAKVLASGALDLDRRWAFVDGKGRFVNGKNRPTVHEIRAVYDLASLEVALDGHVYSLKRQRREIEVWASARLGEPIKLQENLERGFADDMRSPGPTFVSEGSLALVAQWFELRPQETRLRFRTNVEFDGVEAFWEDRLCGSLFRVGDVNVSAIDRCTRCVVPSRSSSTGQVTPEFQKRFVRLRKDSSGSAGFLARFDNYYRFAITTRIASSEAGKVIRIGDEVTSHGSRS